MYLYYTRMNHREKKIIIYSNQPLPGMYSKHVTMSYFDITFEQIAQAIEGKLFFDVKKLRLFNSEGIEIFEEDLIYLKDQTTVYASINGQSFNSEISLSQYKIQEHIGEGGFGRVMLGQHRLTGERRAIKIVDARKYGNAQEIDTVFREAEMLKMLNHKNIVKIHNCFTLKNMRVAFIMDYLEGGDLQAYVIKNSYLQEDEAKEIFYQIVDAMIYCHQKKIVHRDLKLENIMFDKKDSKNVKIVDFGIAGLQTNFTIEGSDAGSIRYMPPEVLEGKIKKIGPSIDVWALGVILFGLVFGYLPFNGDNLQQIKSCIINGIYDLPASPKVSNSCKNLIAWLLKIDPHQRFKSSFLRFCRIKTKDIMYHPWMNDLRQEKINLMWKELNENNQMFSIQLEQEQFEEKEKQSKTRIQLLTKKTLNAGSTIARFSKFNYRQDPDSTLPKISLKKGSIKPQFRQKENQSNNERTSINPKPRLELSKFQERISQILSSEKKTHSVSPDKISSNLEENKDQSPVHKLQRVYTNKVLPKRYHSPQNLNSKEEGNISSLNYSSPSPSNYQSPKSSPSSKKIQNLIKIQPPLKEMQIKKVKTTNNLHWETTFFEPRKTFQRIRDAYSDTIRLINVNSEKTLTLEQ